MNLLNWKSRWVVISDFWYFWNICIDIISYLKDGIQFWKPIAYNFVHLKAAYSLILFKSQRVVERSESGRERFPAQMPMAARSGPDFKWENWEFSSDPSLVRDSNTWAINTVSQSVHKHKVGVRSIWDLNSDTPIQDAGFPSNWSNAYHNVCHTVL